MENRLSTTYTFVVILAFILLGGCAEKRTQSPIPNQVATQPVSITPESTLASLPPDENIVEQHLPSQSTTITTSPPLQDTISTPNSLQQNTPSTNYPSNNGGYSGNCACPNDIDSAGRRCGGRSSYSRAGGYNAVCTPTQSFAYLPSRPYAGGNVSVRGYFRKNGTYVRPYTRRSRR